MPSNIMVDIETLSTEPNAVVLTIGAVEFSLEEEIEDPLVFSAIITRESCEEKGLTVSADTLAWWERQSEDAKNSLTSPDALPLEFVLDQFTQFCIAIREKDPHTKLNWWGNDPTFDAVILEQAYKACDKLAPWAYYETRSCRTMDMIGELYGFKKKRDLPREGVHHNAVDDCIYQAKVVTAIHRLISERA